ncbi:hypothetical protein RyT2_03070 [Pseudolactococcus yaeyamensis]
MKNSNIFLLLLVIIFMMTTKESGVNVNNGDNFKGNVSVNVWKDKEQNDKDIIQLILAAVTIFASEVKNKDEE